MTAVTTMNGQQIYENFANAPGPESLSAAQEMLGRVAAEYRELAAAIAGVAAAFEEGWTGDAAGAAERGAGPLTEQHVAASEALDVAQDLLRHQVESFWLAKNTVEPVPPIPPAPSSIENVITFGSAGASYEQFVTESCEVAQRNVAAMELWANHCAQNTVKMPTSYGEIATPEVSISVAPGAHLGGTGGGPGPNEVDTAPSTPDTPGHTAGPGAEAATPAPGPATTPDTETDPGTTTDPDSDPEPGTDSGTDPESGTDSDSDPETGAESEPGSTQAALADPGAPAAPGTHAAPGTSQTPQTPQTPGTPGTSPDHRPLATPLAPTTGAPQPAPGAGRLGQPEPAKTARATGQAAKAPTPIAGTPAAARGRGAEDEEHERRYGVPEDKHFQPGEDGEKIIDPRTGLPVSQPVIGG